MRKTINITILVIALIAAALSTACDLDKKPPKKTETPSGGGQGGEENPYLVAEILAKRVVLYRLANQEGDLGVFTAMPDAVASFDVPVMAKQVNEIWWKIPWEGVRLAPLPSTEITALEPRVFPLIATSLVESDEKSGWALFSLGYDPTAIALIVADAHNEWTQEEREVFLGFRNEDCYQVWCVKVSGEWKILAHLPCQDNVSRPTPPEAPAADQNGDGVPDSDEGPPTSGEDN